MGTEYIVWGVFFHHYFFFFFFLIAFLGPAEVNISSCLNCLNVTIKLPTSHFRENDKLLSLIDIYKDLDYVITLKTSDGEHKVKNILFYLCFRGEIQKAYNGSDG